MKFRFDPGHDGIAWLTVVFLFNDDCTEPPEYNFCLSADEDESFANFGIYEIMEGIFSLPKDKSLDEVREFLTKHGCVEG